MTPQELKNSILQLAIQGKLVEQRPDEGTAEELYRQIQAEKQALIKAGKIKKEKPLSEITEDEIPFDIPKSWMWVRIGSLLNKLVDGTHRTPKYTLSGVPFVSVRNMSNGKLSLEDTKFISEEEHQELWNRCNPQKGDILLSKVGTTGVPAKVDIDEEFSLFVSVALLKFNNELMDIDFLVYSILAPDFQKQCKEHTRGVGNKNWVIVDIANTIMPLPPLAEQKRIVAKIEELLPLIDHYEAAWTKLENFNRRFPMDMQKSLLQMAIQGRLVEQRPEEGTGEKLYTQIQAEKQALIEIGEVYRQKQFTNISDDEIPFDIPDSWKWCKLGELTKTITKGSSPKWQGISYTDKERGILFITSENVGVEQLLLSKEKYVGTEFNVMHQASILQKGDLLTNIVGASIGRTAVFDLDIADANINQAVCIIRLVNQSIADYVLKFLNSAVAIEMMTKKAVDSARANLSLTSVTNLLIPLPPVAEQKRIVAKLEELLPLCEKLK